MKITKDKGIPFHLYNTFFDDLTLKTQGNPDLIQTEETFCRVIWSYSPI